MVGRHRRADSPAWDMPTLPMATIPAGPPDLIRRFVVATTGPHVGQPLGFKAWQPEPVPSHFAGPEDFGFWLATGTRLPSP